MHRKSPSVEDIRATLKWEGRLHRYRLPITIQSLFELRLIVSLLVSAILAMKLS